MVLRARRLLLALLLAVTTLASCTTANPSQDSPASSEAPVATPAASSPAAGSPSSASSSPSPSSACVAPAGAELQDQDPDDHQVPWRRDGAPKVVITFQTEGLPADWVAELERGVAAWNRSACLDTRLVPVCQPDINCVTVAVGDGDGADGNFNAVEMGGFTTSGHIDLSDELSGGARTNVTIHEMGHAVGLAHRQTERVLMNGDTYDDVFDADQIDFENLLVLYGGQS